jgi:hypothetical protein
MPIISLSIFEATVVRLFEPLAQCNKLSLLKTADGIFEIPGKQFDLRIRRGIGHRKDSGDFVVTLSPKKSQFTLATDLTGEIGLGNFVEFHCEKLPARTWEGVGEFQLAMTRSVEAVEKFYLPILLGDEEAFKKVRHFVDLKINEIRKAKSV